MGVWGVLLNNFSAAALRLPPRCRCCVCVVCALCVHYPVWGSAPRRRQATQKNMRTSGPQAPDGLRKGALQFYSVRNCLDQVRHNELWLNLSDSSLSALSNRCDL